MTDKTSPRPQPPGAAAPAPRTVEAAEGFALQFDKTSLWDLVQFECLRRSQRILRILSQGQVGFIYFRGGQMVHANTLRAVGEPAVREMLGWKTGSVEPWSGAWPDKESITTSWQSLLLGAAEAAPAPVAPPPLPPVAAVERPVESVLLASNGRILRGPAGAGLAEAAAYAGQMADLIGEFLGVEGFQTLEASFERTHYRLSRTREGNMLAQRGADPSLFEGATPPPEMVP
jgi:hypothetical protein